MPLFVDGVQGVSVWQAHEELRLTLQPHNRAIANPAIELALINNMPDLALEDTELQFFRLLERASQNLLVRLRLFSLPHIPRGADARERLSSIYFSINELWKRPFDAAIITGTEPRKADLHQEPYWPALADVLDWAGENTASTILSCLAAHAAVLHGDGIRRQRLNEKRFGVFEVRTVGESALIAEAGDVLRCPHSRWNEVSREDLVSCGYAVLTQSERAGADLFVKKRAKSLFVHFQGHPEYEAPTLLKEYRRDVRRFLRGERPAYPLIPLGYFDVATIEVLSEFQKSAVAQTSEDVMRQFPMAFALQSLQNTWQESATSIYRNWLTFIALKKVRRPLLPGVSPNVHSPASTLGQEIV